VTDISDMEEKLSMNAQLWTYFAEKLCDRKNPKRMTG
jgi:hypothetical protein